MSSRRASICKKSTIIIQYFLAFCDPTEEFFQNIRLVSKPWKHAIETMKYEELDCSFWEKLQTHGGKFPPFLKKYLQMFQELIILIPNPVFEEWFETWNFFEHWDSLRPLILNNSTNLSLIQIVELEEHTPYHHPQNFNAFLCTLTKNSQNTLKIFETSYNFLPPFPLPNVEEYTVSIGHLRPDDSFSGFVGKTPMDAETFEGIITKATELLPNLETISLNSHDLKMRYEDSGLNDPIIKLMTQKYKKNLYANPIFHKVDFVAPKVSRFQYPSSNFIKSCDLQILEVIDIDFPQQTLQNPFSWLAPFKFFIEGCTKLEIVIFHNPTEKDFWSCNSPNFSEEEKIIWKQLFLLKFRGVTLYFEDNSKQFYTIDYKKFKTDHGIDWKFKFQI